MPRSAASRGASSRSRRSMRWIVPTRPKRYCTAAMSITASGPPSSSAGSAPATFSATSPAGPPSAKPSPGFTPSRAIATGVSHAAFASRSAGVSPPRAAAPSAMNPGCSRAARKGSMPITRRADALPGTGASSSTTGEATATAGCIATAAKAASVKPLRGPLTW